MTLLEAYLATMCAAYCPADADPATVARIRSENVRRGEAAAVVAAELYKPKYRRFLLGLRVPEELVDDLIQTVLARWLKRMQRPRVASEEHVVHTIYRALQNEWSSVRRRQNRRLDAVSLTAASEDEVQRELEVIDPRPLPDERLTRQEEVAERARHIRRTQEGLRADAAVNFTLSILQLRGLASGELDRETLLYEELSRSKGQPAETIRARHQGVWCDVLATLGQPIPEERDELREHVNAALISHNLEPTLCLLRDQRRFDLSVAALSTSSRALLRDLRRVALERELARDRYQRRHSNAQQRLRSTLVEAYGDDRQNTS